MSNQAYHMPHATEANKTVCGRPIEVNGRPKVLLTASAEKKHGTVCGRCKALLAGKERSEKAAAKHRTIRQPKKQATRPAQASKRTPALASFPNRPAELVVTYKGTEHKATVNADGTITVNGKTFNSPSRAGKEITGREVDGWTFWRYEAPGEGLKKLDALRQQSA
jgi:hypothetical protein